jgi:hypothetical protein
MAKVLKNGSINLTFRRNFGEEEQEEWDGLRMIVENMTLNAETDSVGWVFEKSGLFTTATRGAKCWPRWAMAPPCCCHLSLIRSRSGSIAFTALQ